MANEDQVAAFTGIVDKAARAIEGQVLYRVKAICTIIQLQPESGSYFFQRCSLATPGLV
jgi:hypothetical protein